MAPASSRIRLTVVALALATVLVPAGAQAWNFDEHRALSTAGYESACNEVVEELKLDKNLRAPTPANDPCLSATDEKTIRWCLACRTYTPALYGQSVAIAGDHVGSPEELSSVEGQQVAASATDYAFLALVNVQHFHPAAPRNWRTFHDQALALATRDHSKDSISQDFAKAFYTSAFADHFLQDVFAAGHAGFNRPSSGAIAAKGFHDIWNRAGRLVKSPSGACWREYGDDSLASVSPYGRGQMDSAEQSSVLDVLEAFVTGTRDERREIRPTYFFPLEITRNPLPEPVWARRGTEDKTAALSEAMQQVMNTQLPDAGGKQQVDGAPCVIATDPIDGMSNPAVIGYSVDFWGTAAIAEGASYGTVDALFNHHFFDVQGLPFAWEAGVGPAGYASRDGRASFAPSASAGLVLPPLYLVHGLWRNELVLPEVRGYVLVRHPAELDGYVAAALRSSVEIATVMIRLQAGPSIDFRTGHLGVVAALGVQIPQLRWIAGGGSM